MNCSVGYQETQTHDPIWVDRLLPVGVKDRVYILRSSGLAFQFRNGAWVALFGNGEVIITIPIPHDRTCWINADISADDTVNRIFKTYASAVIWIQANGALSANNKWCVKASTLGSITCYDNILLDVNRITTLIWGRTASETADKIGHIGTCNLNGGNAYIFNSYVGLITGNGALFSYNSILGSISLVSGRSIAAYNCQIGTVSINNGNVNLYNCQVFGTFTSTAGTSRLYDCQIAGTTTVNGGNLSTYSHQGAVTVNGGTWTNEGELVDSRAFSGNLATTDNNTQKIANKLDTLPIRYIDRTYSPTAGDVASGDITLVAGRTITTTANLTGLNLTGMVIKLDDGNMECCLIESNTDDTITVDADFTNIIDVTWTWRVLKTYTITDINDTMLALYLTAGDCGVVFPSIANVKNRTLYNIYIENCDPDYKAFLVTQGADGITSQYLAKHSELTRCNQSIVFAVHKTIVPHFDVVSNSGTNKHLTGYFSDDYELEETTDEQLMLLNTSVTTDNENYFKKYVDDNGFVYYKYISLISAVFKLNGQIAINRSSGASANVDLYWKKNITQLNRSSTFRFAAGDTDNVAFEDVVMLAYGDIIRPYIKRASASGTYTILAGSSVIINEL